LDLQVGQSTLKGNTKGQYIVEYAKCFHDGTWTSNCSIKNSACRILWEIDATLFQLVLYILFSSYWYGFHLKVAYFSFKHQTIAWITGVSKNTLTYLLLVLYGRYKVCKVALQGFAHPIDRMHSIGSEFHRIGLFDSEITD